jgi:hypothetical protein
VPQDAGIFGRDMKNKLQYAYTITVFIGVLFTAYLMMNTDINARVPLRTVETAPLRTEAQILDPGLNQLFEMENALNGRKDSIHSKKRVPSDTHSDD